MIAPNPLKIYVNSIVTLVTVSTVSSAQDVSRRYRRGDRNQRSHVYFSAYREFLSSDHTQIDIFRQASWYLTQGAAAPQIYAVFLGYYILISRVDWFRSAAVRLPMTYRNSLIIHWRRESQMVYICEPYLDRVKRIWYLSPMRAAKVQASLRIRAVSPEPSLLAHTINESSGTFRQKAISLAPLNGWACAVKICHDGNARRYKFAWRGSFIFSVPVLKTSCWNKPWHTCEESRRLWYQQF